MSHFSEFISYLGYLFANLVAPLLNWIIEPNVGPGLAFSILIIAAAIFIVLFSKYLRDWLLISKALKVLKPYGSQKLFSENFNVIHQDLILIRKIKSAWDEFTETLILPKKDKEGNILVCANTERPHEFFTLEQLSMGPSFAKSLPNIFIGVGLSLTFLGLIAALTEAVGTISNLGSDTADQTTDVQKAITQLLLASSAKFYASLFALFSSIILTIQIKAATTLLNSRLNELNTAIEDGVKFQSIEELSRKTNEILENQLSQLQTFNTDLAMKIGDQLRETFQPIITKIENIGGDITEGNLENMRNISQGIADGIQGATRESMAEIAEKLDSVSEKLEGLGTILSSSIENFDSDFKAVLQQLKDSLEASTKNIASDIDEAFDGMKNNITGTKDEVGEILVGLKSSMESLSSRGKEIADTSANQLRESMAYASDEASKSIATAGKTISDELEKSAGSMKDSITDAAIIAKEQISNAGKDIAEGFSGSTKELVASLEKITTKLNILEESLKALPEQFSSISSTLAPITTDMKQASIDIRAASTQFESAGSTLESTITPLTQYVSDSKAAIESISTELQQVSDQVTKATSSIDASVTTLQTEISSQVQELTGSDEKLASLHQELIGATEAALTRLKNFSTQVDDGFRRSIGTLETAIDNFGEVIKDLKKNEN